MADTVDPILAAVEAYVTSSTGGSRDTATVSSALTAERAAQARVCRVDRANMPADLIEALCRRVVRNLAMRALPLGIMSDDLGSRPGARDPEISRLERPFRKLAIG